MASTRAVDVKRLFSNIPGAQIIHDAISKHFSSANEQLRSCEDVRQLLRSAGYSVSPNTCRRLWRKMVENGVAMDCCWHLIPFVASCREPPERTGYNGKQLWKVPLVPVQTADWTNDAICLYDCLAGYLQSSTTAAGKHLKERHIPTMLSEAYEHSQYYMEGLGYQDDTDLMQQWVCNGSIVDGDADALKSVDYVHDAVQLLLKGPCLEPVASCSPKQPAYQASHHTMQHTAERHIGNVNHTSNSNQLARASTSAGADVKNNGSRNSNGGGDSGSSRDSRSEDTSREGSSSGDSSSGDSSSEDGSSGVSSSGVSSTASDGNEEEFADDLSYLKRQRKLQEWKVLRILTNDWDLELLRAAAILDADRYLLKAQHQDAYLVPAHVGLEIVRKLSSQALETQQQRVDERQLNSCYHRWAAAALAKARDKPRDAMNIARELDDH